MHFGIDCMVLFLKLESPTVPVKIPAPSAGPPATMQIHCFLHQVTGGKRAYFLGGKAKRNGDP